jgi:EpsI family protein
MSAAELMHRGPGLATPPSAATARGTGIALWARVVLACALLAASGGIRSWQARRIGASLEKGRLSPFPLEQLPMNLGAWHGRDEKLDPQIARGTGSTDRLFRRYVNQETGVVLDVYILYGPSAEMYIHMPEVCYPTAGYAQVEGPDARTIAWGDGLAAPFRSLVYNKGEGGQTDREEVYYSWRYNGRWSPEVGTQKQFERIPGMFKLHIARRVTPQERRLLPGNPCEDFLTAILPEIERRLAEVGKPASASLSAPAMTNG